MTASDIPAAEQIARLAATIAALLGEDDATARFGVAVSGGPDSLALLLLAHAAFPGRVAAATVDHGLRPDAGAEAMMVAAVCATLDVPHAVLRLDAQERDALARRGGLQANARRSRYGHLRQWCRERRLPILLTAHHADDQAETLLMRLARGSGLTGLAAIRPVLCHKRQGGEPVPRFDPGGWTIVRPLLGIRKAELVAICAAAGLTPASDPSNDDPRFDRTHARRLLAATPWLAPERVAAAAAHLADAEDALVWATRRAMVERRRSEAGRCDRFVYDLDGLPRDIIRRIAADAIARIGWTADPRAEPRTPDGPDLDRLIAKVAAGGAATLGHALVRRFGGLWTFTPAPPRRSL